jgi:hypothetical protein
MVTQLVYEFGFKHSTVARMHDRQVYAVLRDVQKRRWNKKYGKKKEGEQLKLF